MKKSWNLHKGVWNLKEKIRSIWKEHEYIKRVLRST